mmetsp:Transcript_103787/g.332582  ORF Transcript_103787/g.332582 Transcript_103787/m.332582 type:complete len:259 (-) Transcript_103787:683-1459(-)
MRLLQKAEPGAPATSEPLGAPLKRLQRASTVDARAGGRQARVIGIQVVDLRHWSHIRGRRGRQTGCHKRKKTSAECKRLHLSPPQHFSHFSKALSHSKKLEPGRCWSPVSRCREHDRCQMQRPGRHTTVRPGAIGVAAAARAAAGAAPAPAAAAAAAVVVVGAPPDADDVHAPDASAARGCMERPEQPRRAAPRPFLGRLQLADDACASPAGPGGHRADAEADADGHAAADTVWHGQYDACCPRRHAHLGTAGSCSPS